MIVVIVLIVVRPGTAENAGSGNPAPAASESAEAPAEEQSDLDAAAEEAGIADELDWTVPRDLPEHVYAFMSAMQGENAGVEEDGPYYEPYA